jgi:hypothetical protein
VTTSPSSVRKVRVCAQTAAPPVVDPQSRKEYWVMGSSPLTGWLTGPRTCAGQSWDCVVLMLPGADVRQYWNQLVVGEPSVSP